MGSVLRRPAWNIERKGSRSAIEINWGLNGEHKNVRQLTLKIVSSQT
jgi:hypothetical protein